MQLWKTIFLAAAVASAPALAQQTSEDVAEELAAELAAGQRPDMPVLFFRGEQRRVLEAVRQGVVEQEDFEIEEFVPVIIEEEIEEEEIIIPEVVEEIRRERDANYLLDAYVVNRSSGKGIFWLNGRQLEAEEDARFLSREGLVGETEGEDVEVRDGVLHGADLFLGTRFRVKVGQVLGINGAVEETLPVVRIHKK